MRARTKRSLKRSRRSWSENVAEGTIVPGDRAYKWYRVRRVSTETDGFTGWTPKQAENIKFNTGGIRFELNEGTPRSGKTTSDALKMARFYLTTRDNTHLILAYSQEQAYRMFIDGEGYGLMHTLADRAQVKHDEHGGHLLIRQPSGRDIKVYYKGGGKSNAVGAITGLTLGSVVFLEYNLLHKEVISECFRRTMVAKDRYHLAEQNPPAPNHPNLKLFKQFEEDGSFVFRHWRPHDNPAFTPERLAEVKRQSQSSPYLFARDWLGERVLPQGALYGMFEITGNNPRHRIDKIPADMQYIETIFTADGGTTDATTCSFNQIYFKEGHYYAYRLANYYHSNGDTGDDKAMSDYAREITEFMSACFSYDPRALDYTALMIDPACKVLKQELKKLNVSRIRSADNNGRDRPKSASGSMSLVMVGIEYGQTVLNNGRFALVDDMPDKLLKYGHGDFIREVGLYVINPKTGKPVDAYNHALDEFRYFNNYFYKKYLKNELQQREEAS